MNDAARELADVAAQQCAGVARVMLDRGRVPALVLCSSAVRAQQTWDLVAAALPQQPAIRVLDELYLAGLEEVIDLLHTVPAEVTDVLVVGHEPTMSATADYLAADDSDQAARALVRVGVPTASLCLLHTDGQWSGLGHRGATLTEVVT
ncbi:MAG: SixA phosphatase family protein [Beutenbergiaceae bacterium]